MEIARTNSTALKIDKLPDGSKIIVDSANQTVFALNATAGAAWDACSGPTTLHGVTETMRHSLHSGTTEAIAREAIQQLENHNLVKASEPMAQTDRRQFIAGLGAIALPLVVCLTMADQRAYAKSARSFDPGGNIDNPHRHHHGFNDGWTTMDGAD